MLAFSRFYEALKRAHAPLCRLRVAGVEFSGLLQTKCALKPQQQTAAAVSEGKLNLMHENANGQPRQEGGGGAAR